MNATLDELYLRWLYRQVSPVTVKNPARTYWSFTKQLFSKEFVWIVPNDDNRVADGKDLREEFLDDFDVEDVGIDWLGLGCSYLEMLVALSRRLAFFLSRDPQDCFWMLVENWGSLDVSDRQYGLNPDLYLIIDEMMDQVIWRTYTYAGHGGLFPLRDPPRDQRKTELWYQMSFWIMELEGG